MSTYKTGELRELESKLARQTTLAEVLEGYRRYKMWRSALLQQRYGSDISIVLHHGNTEENDTPYTFRCVGLSPDTVLDSIGATYMQMLSTALTAAGYESTAEYIDRLVRT